MQALVKGVRWFKLGKKLKIYIVLEWKGKGVGCTREVSISAAAVETEHGGSNGRFWIAPPSHKLCYLRLTFLYT